MRYKSRNQYGLTADKETVRTNGWTNINRSRGFGKTQLPTRALCEQGRPVFERVACVGYNQPDRRGLSSSHKKQACEDLFLSPFPTFT